jgi:hypothetical protein
MSSHSFTGESETRCACLNRLIPLYTPSHLDALHQAIGEFVPEQSRVSREQVSGKLPLLVG